MACSDFVLLARCANDTEAPDDEEASSFSIDSIRSSLVDKKEERDGESKRVSRHSSTRVEYSVQMVSNNSKCVHFVSYSSGSVVSSTDLTQDDASWLKQSPWLERFNHSRRPRADVDAENIDEVVQAAESKNMKPHGSGDSVLSGIPGVPVC